MIFGLVAVLSICNQIRSLGFGLVSARLSGLCEYSDQPGLRFFVPTELCALYFELFTSRIK